MSDLRHDPIDDRWIAMAANRRTRPVEFVPVEQMRKQIICPFCKGNEKETPRTLAAYGSHGQLVGQPDSDTFEGWLTRVVSNKYPSFSTHEDESLLSDGDENPAASISLVGEEQPASPYQVKRLPGVQELIIPSSRHVTSISELTDLELEVSFEAHRDRLQTLRETSGIEHGMLFLNCRSAAGASLGHIHWQLIGSPLVSAELDRRWQRIDATRATTGHSLLDTMSRWEIGQQERIIRETDDWVVLCPFASRFPLQVRLIPKDRSRGFLETLSPQRRDLAYQCRDIVTRLEQLVDQPAYNILLHLPPFEQTENVNWYVEIFPRLTITAGFEWGTDVWVNPVTPETSARALRAAEVPSD